MSLNIALTFLPGDAASIAAYSQSLAPHIQSDYIIGVNSHPHVTLLQIEGDADVVVDTIKGLALDVPPVIATAPYIKAGSGGLFWYGLAIQKTAALAALQARVWGALGRPAAHNKVGDDYFPHITTGHGRVVDALTVPDVTPLCREYGVVIGVGTSGPEYQLEGILWPDPD
jgi:hypothetical protein